MSLRPTLRLPRMAIRYSAATGTLAALILFTSLYDPSTSGVVSEPERTAKLHNILTTLINQTSVPDLERMRSIAGVRFTPKGAIPGQTSDLIGGIAQIQDISKEARAFISTKTDSRARETTLEVIQLECIQAQSVLDTLRPSFLRPLATTHHGSEDWVRDYQGVSRANQNLRWFIVLNVAYDKCIVGFKLTLSERIN